MISKTLVLLLCADAAWIAVGLASRRAMWEWIVLYWIILTAKNLCDLFRRKECKLK